MKRAIALAVDHSKSARAARAPQLPANRRAQSREVHTVATQMIQEMESDVHKMMGMIQKLKNRVACDDLTGLLRRDEFFHRLEGMRAQAQGGSISVIMLDIDNFKQINDHEGHIVGDHVIHRVAKVIQRCIRAGAEVGRFGGEEFILALCASPQRARVLAEALRRQIEREVNVTVSVGVATAQAAASEIRRMVGQADQALYQAKQTGKNRVCLAA
jgi:diguanylate cyclase (GGDEF)-like protein